MDKKLKNSINVKGHHTASTGAAALAASAAVTAAFQSASLSSNPYVIPSTTTSVPTLTFTPPPPIAHKDGSDLNQNHHQQQQQQTRYQSTRQRTNNNITSSNTTTTNTINIPQSTTVLHKNQYNNTISNNNNNNQPLISAKVAAAAACVASPMEQLAAVHAKATSSRNKNEEAINDLRTRIPEIENIFDIHSRIGNGTFSTVLLGTLKKERDIPENLKRKFAIKHHIPTSHPDRIMKELQCMAKIGGTDNVVGINCCIRYNESVAFIMPYLAHDRFHDFFNKMDVAEVQFYMKNLLIALRHVHRFNVIHRDVKPSNFLYNRRKRQFLLVDFGLAQQVPAPHLMNVTSSTNSLTGKLANLALPGPVTGTTGGEGKRLREQDDDGSAKKSLEGAVAVTGAGEVISGTAKRIRCTGPQLLPQPVATGPTTRAAMAANTGLKGALATTAGSNASPNERKSAGGVGGGITAAVSASHTMSSRLQQKLRAQGGAESVNSSNRTSSAGLGKNTPPLTQTTTAAAAATNNNITSDAKYNTNRNLNTTNSPKCYCYGNHQVCNICLVKKEIHASRAGTPGYRPPEVLLKYPDQTTSVDIWASGVIFLSVLSSVYPFFKAPNDYVALAEMITIFGDKTIRKTAFVLDRLVTLSQKTKPLDLRKLCVRFRNRTKFSSPELLKKYQRPDGTCEVCKNCDQFFFNCLCMESNFVTESLDGDDIFPPCAYDLLYKLLEVNPHKRVTADEALSHPFFQECHNNNNNHNQTTTTSNSTSSSVATTSAPPALMLNAVQQQQQQYHHQQQQNTPTINLAAAAGGGDSSKKTRD